MFRVDIAPDVLEKEAINRRKKLDQDRKKRIFDPRARTMGIDIPALEEQIHIKEAKKHLEEERNQRYDLETLRILRLLEMREEDQEKARLQQLGEINKFRSENQKKTQRKEFDLNDPEALKKDLPARTDDSDPRCSVSGAQLFFGEDLEAKNRLKHQQQQMRLWIQEKLQNDSASKQRQQAEKSSYDSFIVNLDQNQQENYNREREYRAEVARQQLEENKRLEREFQERKQNDKKKEEELNQLELTAQLTGDFLTENPKQAVSTYGNHRVRTDFFKGMRADQRQSILEYQEKQRKENENRRRQQEIEKRAADLEQLKILRQLEILEMQNQQLKKERAHQLKLENEKLAAIAKERQKFMNKVVYTNIPKDEYYVQFNTTSR